MSPIDLQAAIIFGIVLVLGMIVVVWLGWQGLKRAARWLLLRK